MENQVLISLSGGMDSATLIGHARKQGLEPVCVSFNYGSKHNPYELKAARDIINYYDNSIEHHQIDLSGFMSDFRSNLLKDGGDIPEGHYEDESMKLTVVPGRNLIFAAILSGFAQSRNIPHLWLGVHSGDHAIYPDCRPEFIQTLSAAVFISTERKVTVLAPFISCNKSDILEIGYRVGTPYSFTRTCYKDQPVACGKCGSCQERLIAFDSIGKEDPIQYESREILPK